MNLDGVWLSVAIGIHVCVLWALVYLWRNTPDWLQKIVIGLLIVSTSIFAGLEIAELFGSHFHWMVRKYAHLIEHIALVLWVFRLVLKEQEARCLPKSSVSSRTYKASSKSSVSSA